MSGNSDKTQDSPSLTLVSNSSAAATGTGPSRPRPKEEKDPYGLTVLHDIKNGRKETQTPLDLVFVHGLGGGSRRTWTDVAKSDFWPDWLQGFENVRILTFGYDANWSIVAAGSQLGIPDFATQLLEELDLHYFRTKQTVDSFMW